MANYYDNVLQVTGEVKEMNRFIAMCKTNDSDFSLRGINQDCLCDSCKGGTSHEAA